MKIKVKCVLDSIRFAREEGDNHLQDFGISISEEERFFERVTEERTHKQHQLEAAISSLAVSTAKYQQKIK